MKFIRLPSIMINLGHIKFVHIHPEKYTIHLNTINFSGFHLFSSGLIQSQDSKIIITKDKHTDDFDAFSAWMKQME